MRTESFNTETENDQDQNREQIPPRDLTNEAEEEESGTAEIQAESSLTKKNIVNIVSGSAKMITPEEKRPSGWDHSYDDWTEKQYD